MDFAKAALIKSGASLAVANYVGRWAQSPDFQHFAALEYHAMTSDSDSPAAAQKKFEALVSTLMHDVRAAQLDVVGQKNGHQPGLTLCRQLGILLHVVQDLVSHRGMVLDEHIVAGGQPEQDPDIPTGVSSDLVEQISESVIVIALRDKRSLNDTFRYLRFLDDEPRDDAPGPGSVLTGQKLAVTEYFLRKARILLKRGSFHQVRWYGLALSPEPGDWKAIEAGFLSQTTR